MFSLAYNRRNDRNRSTTITVIFFQSLSCCAFVSRSQEPKASVHSSLNNYFVTIHNIYDNVHRHHHHHPFPKKALTAKRTPINARHDTSQTAPGLPRVEKTVQVSVMLGSRSVLARPTARIPLPSPPKADTCRTGETRLRPVSKRLDTQVIP